MFKKLNNWHLSILIAFVSIVSIALIQQYVTAQGTWTNPDSLPGATPDNTFIVNPLGEDLNLNLNKIVGDGTALPNVVINPSGSVLDAISVNNNRRICINGDCKSAWPSVTGGITPLEPTDSYYLPMFKGDDTARTLTNSRLKWDYVNSIMKLSDGGLQNVFQIGDRGRSDTSGQLIVEGNSGNSGKPFILLRVNQTFPDTGPEMIRIENSGIGKGINLIQSADEASGVGDAIYIYNTSVGNSLHIKNTSTGYPLYINDTANLTDTTPFVIDNRGFVGIATSTPAHSLEILGHGDSANSAEVALYTPNTTHNAGHWGIYHNHATTDGVVDYIPNNAERDDLVFWHNGWDQARFTAEGKLYLRAPQICDINGSNCVAITPGVIGSSYWAEDASKNLSRVESNVFLLATTSASLPSGATGVGTRMLWYPNKAAFRAGNVAGTQWDSSNVGNYSVAFGLDSTASGDYSVVAGGRINTAAGAESFVGGGRTNQIFASNGLEAFIGGGYNNKIGQTSAAVQSAIVAGGSNSILGNASFIGSGVSNAINGASSVVVGGTNNIVNSDVSFIGGGTDNLINGFWWSAIVGGDNNQISSKFSIIGGGLSNIAAGDYSFIGGGATSTASGTYSSISGGALNTASGPYSTVGGGIGNRASSDYSVVAGGHYNTASGYKSFVGSGTANIASGQFSAVPGGTGNIAAGNWSFAAGGNMQISTGADKSFVWGYAASTVSVTRDNSFIIFPNDPGGSVPRVGIGTVSPNSTLHVKSNSGNSEIDIQSGSSPYWGIYQDDATDELRFWNVNNNVIFAANGNITAKGNINIVSDGTIDNYVKLDEVGVGGLEALDCDETSEIGRMIWDSTANKLMVCNGSSWVSMN